MRKIPILYSYRQVIEYSYLWLQYALSFEPVRFIAIMYISTNVSVNCLFITFFSLDRTNADLAYVTVSIEKKPKVVKS